MSEPEVFSDKLPSLELAYQHVKDVLQHQAQTFDVLNSKAISLWSAATAIVGIVIPLAIGVFDVNNALHGWNLAFLITILILYLASSILTGLITFPQYFSVAVSPAKVKTQFASLSKERFMVDMISHIEVAYKKNRIKLHCQGWRVRGLSVAVLVLTVSVVAWSYVLVT